MELQNAVALQDLLKVRTLFEDASNLSTHAIQILVVMEQFVTVPKIHPVTALERLQAIRSVLVMNPLSFKNFVSLVPVARTLTVMLFKTVNNVTVDQDTMVIRTMDVLKLKSLFALLTLVVLTLNVL